MMTSDEIQSKLERLEGIAETLEGGSVDLPRAKELREEADELLNELREHLDVADGELIQVGKESNQ